MESQLHVDQPDTATRSRVETTFRAEGKSAVVECDLSPAPGDLWVERVERPSKRILAEMVSLGSRENLESVTLSAYAGGTDELSSAAVAMVRGIAGTAALEFGPRNIRVNTVVHDAGSDQQDVAETLAYLSDAVAAGNTTGGTIDLRVKPGLSQLTPSPRDGVVLVTGAAGGLGRAAVEAFIAAGREVVITDLPGAALERTAQELGVPAIGANLGDASEVERLAADPLLARIDTVAIHHGVGASTRLDEHYDERLAERSLVVNGTTVWRVLNAVLPAIDRNGGGTIIALSSQAGLVAEAGNASYSAAKFAVVGLVEGLTSQLAARGIRIHALCPGPIDTPLWKAAYEGFAKDLGVDPADFLAERLSTVPLRRIGEPSHIGAAALYLSRLNGTGVILAPNGGEVLT
jgi:NAD(P)-dependent dehydrogenase (short-subunit alcohol dehydrogenase family)